VLAHLPGGGMGRKQHDIHAAYACSSCHGVLDGHIKTNFDRSILKEWHLDGMIETQTIMLAEGLIRV
tara:strand:+ start:24067 stop:24267 length:201 start_codon:yes stop_codon:yes gene_type:complete